MAFKSLLRASPPFLVSKDYFKLKVPNLGKELAKNREFFWGGTARKKSFYTVPAMAG